MLVLVEKAAEAIASSYLEAGDLVRIDDRRGQRVQRAGVRDALMGPVHMVETLEFPQNVEQMPLIPDQGPVQQLAPTGLHPAFHDRIHPRHPDTAEHDLDPRIGEDHVEQSGNLPGPVPDQKPRPAVDILQVHDEIPRGLRHPQGRRVRGRAQDPDPSAGVLDHGEHIQSCPAQGDRLEEVAGRQRVGPGRRKAAHVLEVRSGAGSIPASRRISQTVEAATFTPGTSSSPWRRR